MKANGFYINAATDSIAVDLEYDILDPVRGTLPASRSVQINGALLAPFASLDEFRSAAAALASGETFSKAEVVLAPKEAAIVEAAAVEAVEK